VAAIASLPETGVTSPAEYAAEALAIISSATIAGYLAQQYTLKRQ
jgi:hypothetical protein